MSIVPQINLHWYLMIEFEFRWQQVNQMDAMRSTQRHIINTIVGNVENFNPALLSHPFIDRIAYRRHYSTLLYDMSAARRLLADIEREFMLQMRRLFVLLNLSASIDDLGYNF